MDPQNTNVVGVLVTGKHTDRYPLARKAVEAWQSQNYPGNHVLLIVNDHPEESLYSVAQISQMSNVTELHLGRQHSLGHLRNVGIDTARVVMSDVDCIVQWDDDDYSGKDRLLYQVTNTPEDTLSMFRWEIHCNLLTGQAFANCGDEIRCKGFPGTMLWPANWDIRFPDKGKAEDTEFVLAARNTVVLENDPRHYFRCYHGHNTWSEQHVMKRKRGSRDLTAQERVYVDQILAKYDDVIGGLNAEAS